MAFTASVERAAVWVSESAPNFAGVNPWTKALPNCAMLVSLSAPTSVEVKPDQAFAERFYSCAAVNAVLEPSAAICAPDTAFIASAERTASCVVPSVANFSGVNPWTKALPSAAILVVLRFPTRRSLTATSPVLVNPDQAAAESFDSCDAVKPAFWAVDIAVVICAVIFDMTDDERVPTCVAESAVSVLLEIAEVMAVSILVVVALTTKSGRATLSLTNA